MMMLILKRIHETNLGVLSMTHSEKFMANRTFVGILVGSRTTIREFVGISISRDAHFVGVEMMRWTVRRSVRIRIRN